MGIRVYTRIGRHSGISMPWWMALWVYGIYATLVVGVIILVVGAVTAGLLLWTLAVLVDAGLARLHRRPRRLHLGNPPGTPDTKPPPGRSYYY